MRIGGTLLALGLLFGASCWLVTVLKERQASQPRTATTPSGLRGADSRNSPERVLGPAASTDQKVGQFPQVSEAGPWPKVTLSVSQLDFGRMEIGTECRLDFEIRNDGKGELEIAQGLTKSTCRFSKVGGWRVPPGGTARLTVLRSCTSLAEKAPASFEIRTNDPENRSITIPVVGIPENRFQLLPSLDWDFGKISEDEPNQMTGFVVSGFVDDLNAEKLVFNEKRMDVKVVPLQTEAVESLNPRSGFGLEITLKPGQPVGTFRYPLEILTNAPERLKDGTLGEPAVLRTAVTGRREGPVRILGAAYSVNSGLISMGAFEAASGRKIPLTILVREAPEEGLKITSVTSDPPCLKVRLLPEFKASGTTTRYQMELEFPAGEDRGTRLESEPGWVKIQTNHPSVAELELKVCYSAY